MTGAQIITAFETIVDDSLDETLAYQLLNRAKNDIEEERDWVFLRKLDSSQTASIGDSYTSMKTLPTDFRSPLKLYVDTLPYKMVSYLKRITYRDSSRRWYIDWANSQFALTGNVSASKTINLYYKRTTDDITLNTSPVMPSRFHLGIAFRMSEIFSAGLDADERTTVMSSKQAEVAKSALEAMRAWDSDQRERELDGEDANDEMDELGIDVGNL